jgi:hypothetical protein
MLKKHVERKRLIEIEGFGKRKWNLILPENNELFLGKMWNRLGLCKEKLWSDVVVQNDGLTKER